MQTVLTRLLYRVQQVINYIIERPAPADKAFVTDVLPPALARLFRQMSRGDRVHAIRVCRELHAGGVTDRMVLQAALLHDVGKATGVPLLYRVAYTVLKRLAPKLAESLASKPAPAWRRPFVRLAFHPDIGAQLAAEAGASPDVVALIRAHQDGRGVPAHLRAPLAQLQTVDDRN